MQGEGRMCLPLCPILSPTADHTAPCRKGSFVGCWFFFQLQESVQAFSEELWPVPIVPLVQNLWGSLWVTGMEKCCQANFSSCAHSPGGSVVVCGEWVCEGFSSFGSPEDRAWPSAQVWWWRQGVYPARTGAVLQLMLHEAQGWLTRPCHASHRQRLLEPLMRPGKASPSCLPEVDRGGG